MAEEQKKRGGGPKTPEGKEIVRRNPIKHGVLAQTPVIPLVEREEDWERLRQGVFDFFQLEGPLLESLGDRAAMLIWRLQRVARFETEAILHYLEDVPADWEASRRLEQLPVPDSPSAADVREMDRMLMSRLAPDDETMNKVMRYEVRLNRFLLQTLSTIVALKGLAPSGPGRIHRTASLQPGWAKEGLGGPLSETVR